jgi:hypothetical protein
MTSKLYNVDMAKERLTVYLTPEVARALRVSAARRGLKDSDVVEEALREWFLFAGFERLDRTSELSWEEALELAVSEQHASRDSPAKRRKAS